jgi:methyl-CpG-binding domain protein 4
VPVSTLEHLLHPLGLSNTRAKRLIDLSLLYLSNPPAPDILHKSRAKGEPPTPISHLPGVGKYAIDSYRIFCVQDDEWKQVRPTDKPLCRYLVCLLSLAFAITDADYRQKWKWAIEEYRIWTPEHGDVIEANENYYYELIHEYYFKPKQGQATK